MNKSEHRVDISLKIQHAFLQNGMFLSHNFYNALEFIDQNLIPCDLKSYLDENTRQTMWICDAGLIVGRGATRIEAVEDVLRQFLFRKMHENKKLILLPMKR